MKDFKPKVFQNSQKTVVVFHGLCKGCGLCLEKCPQKAITFSKKDLVEIDIKRCNACGICEITCPDCALRVEKC